MAPKGTVWRVHDSSLCGCSRHGVHVSSGETTLVAAVYGGPGGPDGQACLRAGEWLDEGARVRAHGFDSVPIVGSMFFVLAPARGTILHLGDIC